MPEETEDQETQNQETTTETAQTQETQSQESEGGEGKLYAGKYKSVEAMEAAMEHAQSHIETLEREAEGNRERVAESEERAQHEAQARTQTTGDEQKTPRQIAEEKWKSQDYMAAMEALIDGKLGAVQKPLEDRAAEQEQQLRTQRMETVIKEFSADPKNFPKFNELNVDMGKLLEARRKRNANYDSSFANAREMVTELYSSAARNKPDLFKPDPSLAAAAAGGVGSGSRTRLSGPKPSKEAEKRDLEARNAMGVESNPFQGRKSAADLAVEEAQEEEAMARGEA